MAILLGEDEKLVRMINDHWIKYVRPFFVAFLFLLLSALSFLLWLKGPSSISDYLSPLYLLFLVLTLGIFHWLFLIFFSDVASKIIITNKRIIYIHQLLYLQEMMEEISFDQIKSVRAHTNGLLHNILKYGDLIIDPGLHITLVPHPNTVVKEIEQLMGMR